MISWVKTRASQVHVTSSRSESTADSYSSIATYGYNVATTEAEGGLRTQGYSYEVNESASETKSWSSSVQEDIGRRSYTPANGGAAWPHRLVTYTGAQARTFHRSGTTSWSHSYLYGTGNDYTSSQREESRSFATEVSLRSFDRDGGSTYGSVTVSSWGSGETGDTYKYNSSDTSFRTVDTTATYTYTTSWTYSASQTNTLTYLGPGGPARVPIGTVVDGSEAVTKTVTTQTESFCDVVTWNSDDKTTAWANQSFMVDTTTSITASRDRTIIQTGLLNWGEGWDTVYMAGGTRLDGTSTVLLGDSTEVLYRITADGGVTGHAEDLGETFTQATLAASYTLPPAFAGVGVAVVNHGIENVAEACGSFEYVTTETQLTYSTTSSRDFAHGVPKVGEAPSFTEQTTDTAVTEGSRETSAAYDVTVATPGETYLDEASVAAGAVVESVVLSTYRAQRQGQSETIVGARHLDQWGTSNVATGLQQDYTRTEDIIEFLNEQVATVGKNYWTHHISHGVAVAGCATPRYLGVYELPRDELTWVVKKKAPGILSPDGALVCANVDVAAPLKPRAESVFTAYPGMLAGEGAAVWVSFESTRSSALGDGATTCETRTDGVRWTERTTASTGTTETTASAAWERTDYPSADWSHWETQNFHHGYRPGGNGATQKAAVASVVDGEDIPATQGEYRFTEQSETSAGQATRIGGWQASVSSWQPGAGIAYDAMPGFGLTYRSENDALYEPVIALPKWPGA